MYAASSIKNEDSQIVGAVLLLASIDDIFEPIHDIERRLIYYVIIIFVVISLFIYFLSGLFMSSLRSIAAAVVKMSQGHLNIRTKIKGNDEFAQMGKALNIMADKLESNEKTREEFVSNVSHELKTPLSSMKVLSDSILLLENVPSQTYTEFLKDISSEVDRMTHIINDLLTLVKLDRRETMLDKTSVDLNNVIADVIKRINPIAQKKDIRIVFEELKKVTINVDDMKLSLALTNVIENAVKYTPESGVVKVTLDSDTSYVYVSVTDTGVGISEGDQQHIFERFYRVDKTRDRETGGTGLGLAITFATILLHNGQIRVVSRENEGSTFIIQLPNI
jgi:signal transduction histidine kinase